MAKYVMIYHNPCRPETEEEGQKLMAEWMAWREGLGESVADPGYPLGPSKTIGKDGVVDGGGANPACGVTTLEAETMEEAIIMVQKCPHITRGGTVELCEAMDMKM